jgi:hypothetical protein
LHGGVVEIGVHHGKSFIPLALSNSGTHCYAIGLFGAQDKNIDKSGRGDLEIFRKNLKAVGINPEKLTIDQKLSSEVGSEDIVSSVGKVRFFHIDGGHHLDAVINDIALAVHCSATHGVIAIDDVFRPEWPDVSQAIYQESALFRENFTQFAFGFNKAFYCRKEHARMYQLALINNTYLERSLNKVYVHRNQKTLIFNLLPLPEWSLWRMVKWYLANRYLWGPSQFRRKNSIEL